MTIAVFNGDELHILKKIWEDLSERSEDSDHIGIDKETFLKYIPICGLLGERMFVKFDKKKNGSVDFNDFLTGLSILCLGTIVEQIKFLFDVFDINKDGMIPKKDLITIINYIPKSMLCNYCGTRSRSRTRTQSPTHTNSPNTSSNDLVGFLDYTNSCMCDDMFSGKEYLTYDDFSNWIKHTPAILGYIKSVIPCMAEETIQIDNDKPHLWKKGEKTGFMVKRFYLLCGHCLYYYYNKTDKRPKGVIFLPGSIIQHINDPEMEEKGYYGFEIVQQNLCTGEYHHHEKRIFYCKTQNDRNKWVQKLQNLSDVIPFNEEYKIGKFIGQGAFSEVYECECIKSGEKYAVKIINKDIFKKVEKEFVLNEIAILKLVDHPNVIHLKYTYEDRQKIYIVTELIENGDFLDYIVTQKCFDEDKLKVVIRQLLEAIAYLHEFGIVHCDIKPENMLYDKETENIIKLTDFGLSRMIFSNQKIKTACGTINYIAPEALQSMGYGMESDLWSIGIIVYLLVHGKLPFDSDDNDIVMMQIVQEDPKIKQDLSNELKDLLSKLLEKNPKKRISAKDALNHSFLK